MVAEDPPRNVKLPDPAALSALLAGDAIRIGGVADDWRAAVRLAGDALVACGAVEPAYSDAMIEVVERLGPYMVLAPGIALAHAAPSAAVHRPGISLVLLARPVRFGHVRNDPVRLVIGLAAPDEEHHIAALATLTGFLADEERQAALFAASDPDTVRDLVIAYEGRTST